MSRTIRNSRRMPFAAWAAIVALLVIVAPSLALLTAAEPKSAVPPAAGEGRGPEVGGTARAFLDFIQSGSESALRAAPGLSKPVVDKILQHKASGGRFRNLIEFRRITGIQPQQLEQALAPYARIDEGLAIEQARRPVVEGKAAGKGAGKAAAEPVAKPADGELPAPPPPKGEGPIGHVRPGWYAKLPGYENLDQLDPSLKTEFLERVNNERCACGCQNETLAFCLVNDPGCPVVKGRVRKIYEDLTRKP